MLLARVLSARYTAPIANAQLEPWKSLPVNIYDWLSNLFQEGETLFYILHTKNFK